MCFLEEYSTQCRGTDIDQVCVPTVKEVVWEFSPWVCKAGSYQLFFSLYLFVTQFPPLPYNNVMFNEK